MLNSLSVDRAAYLAAAIDGEGNLGIVATNQTRQTNPSFHARIQVSNVKLDWLETLRDWIGDGSIQRLRSPLNERRACYFVRWTGSVAQHVLRQVQPYLLMKRAQADLLFEFFQVAARRKATNIRWQASNPEIVAEMLALRERMKALNARGVSAKPQEKTYAGIVRVCLINGCDRRHYGRGYCKQHYKRYIEHGGFTFYEKQCRVCGRTFTARRKDTETCSKPCSDRNQYLKNHDARNAYKRAWRARQKQPPQTT